MRNNVNKVPEYIRYRVSGLAPRDAAVAAGYAQSGIRVTTTRLEAREDVRKALRAGKRVGKPAEVDDAPPAPEGWKLKDRYSTPLDLMIDLMNNPNAPSGMRYQ